MVKQATEKKPDVNLPLAGSENERARELVNLDQQFVTDVAAMPPEASAYFRRRPFLTAEVCQKFAMGYLPHSAKSLLRGQVVYGYRSPAGELLTWFGRNPRFEDQLSHWKASDRSEPEPIKTRFVKGFHRGLELYGEDVVRAEGFRGHHDTVYAADRFLQAVDFVAAMSGLNAAGQVTPSEADGIFEREALLVHNAEQSEVDFAGQRTWVNKPRIPRDGQAEPMLLRALTFHADAFDLIDVLQTFGAEGENREAEQVRLGLYELGRRQSRRGRRRCGQFRSRGCGVAIEGQLTGGESRWIVPPTDPSWQAKIFAQWRCRVLYPVRNPR